MSRFKSSGAMQKRRSERVGRDASEGKVEEYERVLDKTKTGGRSFHEGPYSAGGSIVPNALGR